MNSLFVIHPYKYHGQWVFDDPERNLDKEALISGIDDMLDIWEERLGFPAKGLVITFSEGCFPSFNFSIDWLKEEMTGNWYISKEFGFEGWLCGSLFDYFKEAPKTIYMKIQEAI